ncbi:MAG: sulfatase-like hydrolase/transferase [Crocinitomicaceae bacterium]|nr:sulfatase-like hydrolase/transferase [Crocinitomicaceae bacterium]
MAQTPPYKTKNVFIIVMDGPRWTETWGDSTHKLIPHMANDMAKEGVIFTDFKNNGPTYTTAGHTALSTGFYQSMKNNGKVLPKHPTIFQYFLKKTGLPKKSAYVITSKDKLAILTNCQKKGWYNQYRPAQDCGINGLFSGYRQDGETCRAVLRILEQDKPNLVIVNFQQPDSWGHANNWENYLKGVSTSDDYIYAIFKFIQTNEHYKDNTTIFVTNDHGRHLDGHKDGFVSHGDGCEGCRHINFFAFGPDFKKGVIMDSGREQIDIPVTAAHLLGFEIPKSDGDVMEELFQSR